MSDAIDALFGCLQLPDYSEQSEVFVFLHNWKLMANDPNFIFDFIQSCHDLLLFRTHQSQSILRILGSVLSSVSDCDCDLSNFIFSFISSILNASPINKIRVFSSELIQFLLDQILSDHFSSLLRNSLTQIFYSLTELGLSYTQLAQIYKASLTDDYALDLLYNCFHLYPTSFKSLILTNTSSLHFRNLHFHDVRKGFTLSTRFQLHSGFHNVDHPEIDPFTLMEISNEDNCSIIRYSIEDSKLVIQCKDTSYAFESFSFELGNLYNVCLLHRCDSKKSSVVDLYIDGEFIQSRTVVPIFLHLSTSKSLFGSHVPSNLNLTLSVSSSSNATNVIPELANLIVINGIQSRNWILLAHSLGPNYAGTYQDTHLASLLDPKSVMTIKLKLREYLETDGRSKKDFDPFVSNIIVDPRDLVLNFHCSNVERSDRGIKINIQTSILRTERPQPVFITRPEDGDVLYWNPYSLINRLFSVGGFGIVLRLIAESTTTDQLVKSLELLFHVLETDSRSLAEFGSKSGYDVLATLLKTKKSLIQMEVLMVILKFIGYNEDSPADSIIANGLAYCSLIADFEIWQPQQTIDCQIDPKSKDTFKFVLFQLSMFGEGSKYHSYNLKKLGDMKIVKRVIQALKYRLVDEDLLPILCNSLLILVRLNPTPSVIRAMSLYVVYALQAKDSDISSDLDKKCGASILDIIVSLVCDPVDIMTPGNFRKVLKSINAKWLMILLDSGEEGVVKMALQLLIRVLSILGPRARRAFNDSGGLVMLRKSLSLKWRDDDLITILFAGSFGVSYSLEKLSVDFGTVNFLKRLCEDPAELSLIMPGFLSVINGLLETSINEVQDLIDDDKFSLLDDTVLDALSSLELYYQVLTISFNEIPALRVFIKDDMNWTSEFLLIVLSLYSLDHIDEFSSFYHRYSEFSGSIFIGKLFDPSSSSANDKKYLWKFCSRDPALFSLTVMPRVFEHIHSFQQTEQSFIKDTIAASCFFRIMSDYFGTGSDFIFDDNDFLQSLDVVGSILFEADRTEYPARSDSTFKICRAAFARSYLRFFTRCTEEEIKEPFSRLSHIKFCFSNFMLYGKVISEGLEEEEQGVIFLLSLLFKNLLVDDEEISSLAANCLRMIVMNGGDLPELSKKFALSFKESVSLNDLELKVYLCSEMDLKNMLNGKFNEALTASRQAKASKLKSEFIKELIANYRLKIHVQHLKRWNLESISKAITEAELHKFNRHIQDDNDDLSYYISTYDRICSKIPVDDIKFKLYLDSTEGRFRMRRKILREPTLESTVLPRGADTITLDESENALLGIESDTDTASYEFVSEQVDLETSLEDKNRKVVRSLYVHDKIVQISNVTQILGLETFEMIVIIGLTHLYLIENYFHTDDGNIVDIDDAPKSVRDPYVQLIAKNDPNNATFSSATHNIEPTKRDKLHRTRSWRLDRLVSISKRKFLLRDVAAELFFADGSSVLITCGTKSRRNLLLGQLSSKITAKYTDEDLEEAMKLASKQKITFVNRRDNGKLSSILFNTFINTGVPPSANVSFSRITKKWKHGELSNFYYLMLINTMAGRTFNDLTQYPVFPFVIADYESDELNLDDPSSFRDLSKPMGAQASKRAGKFKERYEASAEMAPDVPPAHYGTHYSSAMVVASYLIRMEPFVRSYLILQGGKFDHADRLFYSLAKTWKSASCDNTSDVRELIPEFYYLPEFLVNCNNFDFGDLQDGTAVNDVILPPWAHNDPKIFVEKMRQALESDYVSQHLPEWIDLVFGYKQRGEEAVLSLNVFHHLSYAGAIDLEAVADEREKAVVISTIHNFGQTPLQIFSKPHPKRWTLLAKFSFDVNSLVGFPVSRGRHTLKGAVDEIVFDLEHKEWKTLSADVRSNGKLTIRKYSSCNLILNESLVFEQLSQDRITKFELIGSDNLFVVGFEDGSLILYKLTADTLSSITNSQRSSIQQTRMYSGLANPNCLRLQSMDVMRSHSDAIKDIKVSHYNGVLLTLSDNGEAMLWNLADCEKIRDIGNGNENLVNISEEYGYIATVDGENYLKLFTINGDLISQVLLKKGAIVVEFSEFNLPFGCKVNNSPWMHVAIVAVGFEDGTVLIYQLMLEKTWNLAKIGELGTENKITALKLKLGIALDGEGNKVGRGQLLAGTDDGKLLIWG
ncbi:hypothetical protein FOA43_002669 [Brettanomyces nanus]|uniref:Beige protein homolog 1 n=1 Tax=Eeniella nana TaxID=13502 RepID=A0A875RV75_EENNA|nr:uncharacterized protein FOA43_002669 [Brettanomyces nanus]QPG75317.1 hypothetical protein FOA43_002669 [Brettanomyces nanus]